MIEIINAGMYTSVQDYPGRVGYWGVGVPPSGPMDSLAFRVGNKLVGNEDTAAGLEITMAGPTLKFSQDAVIALTGAGLRANLDGQQVDWWKAVEVRKGSVLALGTLDGTGGTRTYLAVRGGIDTPLYLGSRATFPFGNFGGHEGRILKAGDSLPIGNLTARPSALNFDSHFDFGAIPKYGSAWEVGVIAGPHTVPDYFTEEDEAMIYSADWKVHFNSNRLGYRLEGPTPKFARTTGGQGGSHPSNLLDYTYAVGTINFTGNMPVILTADGPSLGGFVSFATIATAELWKIGQAGIGNTIRFKKITIEQGLNLQRWLNSMIDGISPVF